MNEGKTIEFKRDLPEKGNEGSIKFLRAVSSFANTTGGDLVLGIHAEQGLAKAIYGIDSARLDQEKLRLSQILASQLEPRLPKFDFLEVNCGEDGNVLIIRVEKSWRAPHRIKIDNTFYGRNAAGNYPLDVSELRSAFTLSDTVAERIRKFQTDRLIKINAGETPLPMSGAAMVIHVVPLSVFANGGSLDIVPLVTNGHVMPLPPGARFQANQHLVNFDGILTYTKGDSREVEVEAYAQAFRSGAIEGVSCLHEETEGTPYLVGTVFEGEVVMTVTNYLAFLQDMGIIPPVLVFLSFCGVRGCQFRYQPEPGMSGYYKAGPLREDMIILPAVMIDTHSADVPAGMRLAFDTVWNAFGLNGSGRYDAQGKWKTRAGV